MAWKVEYYQTPRGEHPVKDFIEKLDYRSQAKAYDAIAILIESGPFLKPPYMKKLMSNLYELRIKSVVAIRIFYSSITQRYYLLHAFIKKSQKTPKKDLQIALDRMKELI